MAEQIEVLSHWHVLLDSFKTSAKDFYGAVEVALKARGVPNLKVERVEWKEGGLFSAKREYLRASLDSLFYDICAAPYGTGYFFSSWMAVKAPIPVLSKIMSLFGRRSITFYTLDTRLMFRESVHRAVTETIDALGTAQGLRVLTPEQARLTSRDPLA